MSMGESMEISKRKEEGIQEKLIVQLIDVEIKNISRCFPHNFKPSIHRQKTRQFKQKFCSSLSKIHVVIDFEDFENLTEINNKVKRN